MDNKLNIPYLNASSFNVPRTSSSGITGATTDNISHVNFNLLPVFSQKGPPGASIFSFQQPCVHWFGEDYPDSALYERAREVSIPIGNDADILHFRDSVFTGEPRFGWFSSLSIPGIDPLINIFFSGKQQRPFFIIGNDPDVVSDSLLGRRVDVEQLSYMDFMDLSSSHKQIPAFVSPKKDSSVGILATIPTRYWLNFSLSGGFSVNGFQPVPIFQRKSSTADDLDDEISDRVSIVLEEISRVDKTAILSATTDKVILASFFLNLDKFLSHLPYGGVFFSIVSHTEKRYEWIYNIGTERRLVSSSTFPSPGIRQLYLQTALDNAVLRTGNRTIFGESSITQGFRAMPELKSTKIDFPFDGLIGGILYPLGISFLLPIFVFTLVKEKEERIAVMMKMNGLKSVTYYLSHFGNPNYS